MNPLKTDRVLLSHSVMDSRYALYIKCYRNFLTSYLKENTFSVHYKNQPADGVEGNNGYVLQ
jgi:hypothetical protein